MFTQWMEDVCDINIILNTTSKSTLKYKILVQPGSYNNNNIFPLLYKQKHA